MRRRTFLKSAGVGIGAAGGSLAAPAVVRAQLEIRWRCVSSYPKNLSFLFGAAEDIAKRVAAATDNKFQIRVFAGGEIVPGLQVLDAVQNETVECGHSASYYYVGKDATFAFDTAIPFGLNCRAQNAWMYYGGGLELMRQLFRCYNIIQFPAGNTGAQMGGAGFTDQVQQLRFSMKASAGVLKPRDFSGVELMAQVRSSMSRAV